MARGQSVRQFLPLLVLLATIGYGASSLAGQDEDGTLAMVTTLPIRRRRVTVEKSLAMATQAIVIVSVSTAFIAIGYAFDITVGVGGMLGASVGVLLLGIDLGLVALVVGAATGRRESHSAPPVRSLPFRISSVPLHRSSLGSDP